MPLPLVVGFNTQPPEGGCINKAKFKISVMSFNTQPPEGGCRPPVILLPLQQLFQHTAARRRLPACAAAILPKVSFQHTAARRRLRWPDACHRHLLAGFNTQPPEGGCRFFRVLFLWMRSFNTQPPEGGCTIIRDPKNIVFKFQHTAARRRLRVFYEAKDGEILVSTHSRPKAAAFWRKFLTRYVLPVSTHSRPKAAAMGFNSFYIIFGVSTHSRPKAAAKAKTSTVSVMTCFNTQPPEGGCDFKPSKRIFNNGFNTQPPEGGCDSNLVGCQRT